MKQKSLWIVWSRIKTDLLRGIPVSGIYGSLLEMEPSYFKDLTEVSQSPLIY